MKAAVYRKYGPPDVLRLEDIETPVPRDAEVLIKVHATSVNPIDWHFRSGSPFVARIMAGGLLRPKIRTLGFDVAGEIESTGKKASRLRVGDKVYGRVPPGLKGANAEYVSLPEDGVLSMPANITYEEAAAVPTAASVALWFLREGRLRSGQTVLINGASGGIGTFAVQIARAMGAVVTAVCSTGRTAMVRSLGAEEVIDYTKEDFTKTGQTYDLIFDAVGKSSFPDCRSSLNREGVYISTVLTFRGILHMLRTSVIGSKKAKVKIAKPGTEELVFIHDLIGSGRVKSIIDRTYSLEEIVEAHRHAEAGRAQGKIIVTVTGKS